MDQFSLPESLRQSLGGQMPAIIGALLLLLLGWAVALIVAATTRRLLTKVGVNRHLSGAGLTADVELWCSRLVFWFVLLVAVVASFNMLDLLAVSAPFANMLNEVLTYLPRLVSGLVLALVAWVVASLVRTLLTRALDKTTLDERLSADAGMPPISASMGHVAYWLILLMFLPMVLDSLNLLGLMRPVEHLVDSLLGYLPNLVAAGVIGFVGYLIARVVRGIVSNLVQATKLQDGLEKLGLSSQANVAGLAGTVVFLLIFVPSLIGALDALQIKAISDPATHMLDGLLQAVPDLLAASLILVVTFYVARFASALAANLLAGAGFDTLPEKIGLGQAMGNSKASAGVGHLIMFFAMLFATVEAANRLGFTQVRDIVATFIMFSGNIMVGAAVLLIGFWLASFFGGLVARSDRSGSDWLAGLVRALIMGLVLAMGLRAMGIADSIVNLAFGLTLGAIAVAFALAFGLGGREAAGRLLARWVDRLDGKE